MAELKFNFSSFGVPKVKKTKTYEAKKPIVDKNIIGVVGIDITGNYYVTTKTKDYSIFRTLGLISKDLKKMLLLEVLITTIFSIIIGAVITNIIIITTKIDLYKYVSLNMILVYVLLMIIFGLLTAIRLNNKIFKNSVYQGLREGGE